MDLNGVGASTPSASTTAPAASAATATRRASPATRQKPQAGAERKSRATGEPGSFPMSRRVLTDLGWYCQRHIESNFTARLLHNYI